MMIRFTASQTAGDAPWSKTFAALKANRGACDEVWFSTDVGIPAMEWHREHAARLVRYAAQCREAGIVPSLQIQATIGHSDGEYAAALGGTGGKSWCGFTGRDGTECRYCSCPRQKGFLDYMREMSRLYAAFKPGSVWIDDDLRIRCHLPALPWVYDTVGCWCDTCVTAFNAETGGKWTRETLSAAMRQGGPLFECWRTFSIDSIAAVARAIAESVHEVSPETRLACQFAFDSDNVYLAPVFKAMHEATGLPVGARPGGGQYYDSNPNDQILKCFDSMRSRKALGDLKWISPWCPEVETWPRTFAARTAQGLLNEVFASLALGMDSVSMFIMDAAKEDASWYSVALLKPLSEERAFFDRYLKRNAGTVPAGLADETGARSEWERNNVYRFALIGIPVLTGPGKPYGKILKSDLVVDPSRLSSSDLLALRLKMDMRSGRKLPVLVGTPSIGIVVPRVAPDGTLRSVAMLNARIDRQGPVRLRLRNVPAASGFAWHEMRGKSVNLPVSFEGTDCLVEIPGLSAWNWGWLEAGKDRPHPDTPAYKGVAERPALRLGCQLWGVKDFWFDKPDKLAAFAGIFPKVRAMGYEGVQCGAFPSVDQDGLERLLKANGLSVVDQPVSFEDIEDEARLKKTVAYCRRFGVDFVYIPWHEAKTAEGWREFCRRLDAAESRLKPYGIKVGYHHHIHELSEKLDGEYPWDILTASDGARLEMDIGPVLEAGRVPAEEIAKMQGRLPGGIHAKPVGASAAGAPGERQDWPKIVAAAGRSGVKWLVVECEQRKDTYEDIAASARHLRPLVALYNELRGR